jgi:hypothetical protein
MQGYNKALVAIVTAVVSLLANFGIDVSPAALGVVNTLVPVVGAVLVYAIPNR